MAEHTMQEAGQLVGVGRSTIWRLINKGKLSAYKNPLGVMVIDSAELYRVFPQQGSETPQEQQNATPETAAETALLRQRVELLEELWAAEKHRADNLEQALKMIEHKQPEPVKHWWNIKLW